MASVKACGILMTPATVRAFRTMSAWAFAFHRQRVKVHIRKKNFALPRSVTLDVLKVLVRILGHYLALKCIQCAVRDLHVAVALERYI
jgi:hypothetical protein